MSGITWICQSVGAMLKCLGDFDRIRSGETITVGRISKKVAVVGVTGQVAPHTNVNPIAVMLPNGGSGNDYPAANVVVRFANILSSDFGSAPVAVVNDVINPRVGL